MQGKQNLIIQRGYLAGATLMPPGINLWNQFLRESVFRALARERILIGPSNLKWLRILTCDWFARYFCQIICAYIIMCLKSALGTHFLIGIEIGHKNLAH